MTIPKNQLKTTKILLTIGILLNIIVFSSFPESHSKYWDENNSALAYNTRLYDISTKELNLTITSANYKKINFAFSFSKSDFAKDTEKDIYTIAIPKGCTTNDLTNGIIEGNKINYEINSLENTKNVSISCPVSSLIINDNGTEKVFAEVTVQEKIEDENAFLYQKKEYEWTLNDYYKLYPKPTNDISNTKVATFYLDTENKYNDFETWIKKYVAEIAPDYINKYTYVLWNYVSQVYKSDSDIINENLSLPGITMVKDSEKVTITLNDNLIGYARTADDSTRYKGYIYVSATNSDMTNREQNLETAFELYLDSYSRNNEDKQIIIDYVKSFNSQGISHVILPNAENEYNTIPGITYYPEEMQPYGEEKLLILDPNLIDYAYAKIKKQIRIETGKSVSITLPDGTEDIIYIDEMMQYSFKEVLGEIYGDIISENTLSEIKNNQEILSSISQNNRISKSFNDYFMVYDEENQYNLLIKISATESDPYTFVTIEKVESNENIEIQFTDETPTAEITINSLTKTEIESILKQVSLATTTTTSINEVSVEDPSKITHNLKITNGKIEEILTIITKLNSYLENKTLNSDPVEEETNTNSSGNDMEVLQETKTESEPLSETAKEVESKESILTDSKNEIASINEKEKIVLKPETVEATTNSLEEMKDEKENEE